MHLDHPRTSASTADDAQLASIVQGMKQDGIKSSSKARFESPRLEKGRSDNGRNQMSRRDSGQRQAPPMIQHFRGFQFTETDAEWLGVTTEKVRGLVLFCIVQSCGRFDLLLTRSPFTCERGEKTFVWVVQTMILPTNKDTTTRILYTSTQTNI